VKNGVKMGEGDGTVSLLSLGAMCVEGWKKGRRWNPAGIKVVTVEVRIDEIDFLCCSLNFMHFSCLICPWRVYHAEGRTRATTLIF